MKRFTFLLVTLFCGALSAQNIAPKTDMSRPNGYTTAEIQAFTRMVEGSEAWNSQTKTVWIYVDGTWVDSADTGGDFLPLSGGILTGPLQVSNNFIAGINKVNWDSQNSDPAGVRNMWYNGVTDRFTVRDENNVVEELAYVSELGGGSGGSAEYRNPNLVFSDRAAGSITNDWVETSGLEDNQLINENNSALEVEYTYNGSFTSGKKFLAKQYVSGGTMVFKPSAGFDIVANINGADVSTSTGVDGFYIDSTLPIVAAYERGTTLYFQGALKEYTEPLANLFPDRAGSEGYPNSTNITWTSISNITLTVDSASDPNELIYTHAGANAFDFIAMEETDMPSLPSTDAGDQYNLTAEVLITTAGTRARVELYQISGETQFNADLSNTSTYQSIDIDFTLVNGSDDFIVRIEGDSDMKFKDIKLTKTN